MNSKTAHFCDSSIAEYFFEHKKSTRQPLVVLCRDNDHAERTAHTLRQLSEAHVTVIPDNETLPYDEEFPQDSLISDRLSGIWKLKTSSDSNDVFIITARSLLEKIPKGEFYNPSLTIHSCDDVNFENTVSTLEKLKYKKVATVRRHGEFSVNPNTIDVFAFGEEYPVRIYRQDSKNSIVKFSPDTQRVSTACLSVNIFKTKEFPYDESSFRKFKYNYRQQFSDLSNEIFESIKKGILPRGIDHYKTLFMDESTTILEILSSNAMILSLINWRDELRSIAESFTSRYSEVSSHRQIVKPEAILISLQDVEDLLDSSTFTEITESAKVSKGIHRNGVKKQDKIHQTFNLIEKAHNETGKTLITINTNTRMRQLEMMFKMKGQQFKEVTSWEDFWKKDKGFYVLKMDLDYGYIHKKKQFTLITEFEIFDSKTIEEHIYEAHDEKSRIIEINEGEPVVHAKYGVGRFRGFETVQDVNSTKEFAIIEYQDSTNIWVSLSEMNLVSEYKGIDPENVPLDDAASRNWNKHLAAAISDVKSMAYKLLDIKAKRASIKRKPYSVPTFEYRKFANEFPFAITQDQGKAIKNILDDLQSDIAMDRLVVGDVGYGKTEVAMRAAMVVSANKKQCCILAPTTLLAEQHYESFVERFSGMNLNIELFTRDRKSDERELLRKLQSGEVDIVIGTHRLIQKDVHYKDLGLMVVDEEHRFGVKQKEDINKQRGSVDILSLSATPIPRTLSLTMHGIRDISTIYTAPKKRLAIRTIAKEYNENDVVDALKREMGRNGQAFYVFNDTSKIEPKSDEIQYLLPDAKVKYAHGKMNEKELQSIMQQFRAHEFDILVATTIIETGIDIPNANTIIIDSCENFGLSQLHQLRGRVGRSNRQAYAYLMTSVDAVISDRAAKRIQAMVDNNNLGGGFKISNADLEIRGAGEVLGENQSGHIQEIGYQMYFSLLEKAVKMLENGESLEDLSGDNEQLMFYIPYSLNIPNSYIEHKGLKAAYYKAIAEQKDESSAQDVLDEMRDRFGNLPSSVCELSKLVTSKVKVIKRGLRKCKVKKDTIEFVFDSNDVLQRFSEGCVQSDIATISVDEHTVHAPFHYFSFDGVIDYRKVGGLLN